MMKFKVFFLCLLSIFLCGCTPHKTDVETIKFSTWGSASEMAILKPIILDFESQNPNIKIDLIHIPQNYFQKIHLLFASNLAPDVIFINNLNLPVYANHLTPVKNIDKSCFYQQSIDVLSYNNNLYAVPRDVSNLVIYYNKDLFDKKNISYPKSNWTIDEFLNTAKKLTSHDTFGIGYEEDFYYALPYLLAFNDFDKTSFPSDDVKKLAGMKFYMDLVSRYHVAPSKSDIGSKTLGQMFLEEQIGMHLSGRWLVPKYRESATFNWGVINFPNAVPCDASGWAISKDSQYKKSAQKFIAYLSNKNNIEKMAKSGLIVPARKDVIFKDKIFTDVIKTSVSLPISPSYNKIVDKINDTLFLSK